jgi:hypothetical protein
VVAGPRIPRDAVTRQTALFAEFYFCLLSFVCPYFHLFSFFQGLVPKPASKVEEAAEGSG